MRQDLVSKDVRSLQLALNSIGFRLSADGIMGPRTWYSAISVCRWGMGANPREISASALSSYILANPRSALSRTNRLPGSFTLDIKPVPYLWQRDNFYEPSATCNVTAVGMALASRGTPVMIQDERGKMEQLEDFLYRKTQSEAARRIAKNALGGVLNVKTNTVHKVLEWLLKDQGVSAAFTTKMTEQEICDFLGEDPLHLVMLTGKFTKSGHIVLAVGYSPVDHTLVVHDPWGDWNLGYQGESGHRGDYRIYLFDQKWNSVLRTTSSDSRGNPQFWCTLIY